MTEPNENQRWVKVPGPGQFRGEGEWVRYEDLKGTENVTFEWFQETGYLPVYTGEQPPVEQAVTPSVR